MSKRKSHKLKSNHMTTFVEEAEKLISALGLSDYEVHYEFEELDNAYAACIADMPGQIATLVLNKEWPEPITDEQLKKSARHEVIELMFQPIWHAVLCRELNINWANSQRHAAIRRLEKVFDQLDLG